MLKDLYEITWKWQLSYAAGHILRMSTLSTEQLAVVYNISRTNIQRILKYHKFHSYKIKLQELNEDDFDRRLQFCERPTNKVLSLFLVSVFPINVLFLNGTMNRHNCLWQIIIRGYTTYKN